MNVCTQKVATAEMCFRKQLDKFHIREKEKGDCTGTPEKT